MCLLYISFLSEVGRDLASITEWVVEYQVTIDMQSLLHFYLYITKLIYILSENNEIVTAARLMILFLYCHKLNHKFGMVERVTIRRAYLQKNPVAPPYKPALNGNAKGV